MNLAIPIISALAVLVAFLAYRVGRRQWNLGVAKAIPKVGTWVRIDKRQEQSTAFSPSYYMVATIYNEGELPAKQLKGHCKLFSPINEVKQHTIPIIREFLGSAPYELEPCRLEGTTVDVGMDGRQDIRFNVDIEFEFFGIPDDKPQKYSAKHEWDNKNRQMIKIE